MPTVVNVARHLARSASERPFATAVIAPAGRDGFGRNRYVLRTFRQLHDDSDAVAHGLRRVGIKRGTRTVLMVTPSIEFFLLTFALFKVGAVPVLIDPGMGRRNLGRCLDEAAPEGFIGIGKAHLARLLFGWGRRTIRTTINSGRSRFPAGHALAALLDWGRTQGPFPQADTTADEQAAILFTSGSTGIAKGAVYTHGIFAAQVEMLRELYNIQPGEVDLATFPLFALFGPALGMTAVIPEMNPTRPAEVDPTKIIRAIEDWGVTNMFGSPALINQVGRYCEAQGHRLRSLKRVTSAGAPVPASVIARFVSALSPGVQVHTPYGATESLPVASIASDTILGETRFATEKGAGVCVGYPVPGVTVSIIPITEEPIERWEESLCLPPGTIGEICVRGPIVSPSYWRREEQTRLAKIPDPAGGVRHRMGDVGYLDERGRLWFCGRKSQRVRTATETLFTIPCEGIFNRHAGVYRSALVGVQIGGVMEPVICIEREPTARLVPWPQLRSELLALAQAFPATARIRYILEHPKFPVDIRHNAKIFREKLALWAAQQLRRGLPAEMSR